MLNFWVVFPPSGNIIKRGLAHACCLVLRSSPFFFCDSHGVSTHPRFQRESLLPTAPAATTTATTATTQKTTTIDQTFFASSGGSCSRRVTAKQIHHPGSREILLVLILIDLCKFAMEEKSKRIFGSSVHTRRNNSYISGCVMNLPVSLRVNNKMTPGHFVCCLCVTDGSSVGHVFGNVHDATRNCFSNRPHSAPQHHRPYF